MSRWRTEGRRLGLALAFVAVVLVACPGAEREPTPGERASAKPSAPAPSPGRTIRFGLLGEPATLDPYRATASEHTWTIARTIYPSLFEMDPEGAAEPSLAGSIEQRSGGAVVVLRPARWSDGRPVTAADVVASWRRARSTDGPSGFRDIASARADGPRTVVLGGNVADWPRALARVAFVLPKGRHGVATSGPFRLARRTPGLEVVLRPDPGWYGAPRATGAIRVQFIQTSETMMRLLEEGDLDAAAIPSMVNLSERLDAAGLEGASRLGWESIRLSFGAGLGLTERYGLVRALNVAVIEETLIREDGRRASTLHPDPEDAEGPYRSTGAGDLPSDEITITAPLGDELLTLLLRAVYTQLDRAGVVAEAAPIDPFIFYGQWRRDDPSHVSIRRASGAPGLSTPPDDAGTLDHFPMFQVATYIARRPGVEGPAPNPTLAGPLWNAETWVAAGGS